MTRVAVALLFFLITVCVLSTTIYGLVLAFKASIVLGLIVLLVQPTPFLIGLIGLCGHPEVSQKIAVWLGLT